MSLYEFNLIYNSFQRHYKKLREDRSKADEVINDWVKEVTDQVHKNASVQRQIVAETYNKASERLSQLETHYQETRRVLMSHNKTAELNSLLDTCRTLQEELSIDINYKYETIRFLQMKSSKSSETNRENQDQTDQHRTTDPNSSASSGTTHKPDSYAGAVAANSDSRPRPGTPSRHPSASVPASNSQHNQVANNTSNGADDPKRTCQMCFMIYPPGMTEFDVRKHVNAHLD